MNEVILDKSGGERLIPADYRPAATAKSLPSHTMKLEADSKEDLTVWAKQEGFLTDFYPFHAPGVDMMTFDAPGKDQRPYAMLRLQGSALSSRDKEGYELWKTSVLKVMDGGTAVTLVQTKTSLSLLE